MGLLLQLGPDTTASATESLLNAGVLGAVLVLAIVALVYVTRRFVNYLENNAVAQDRTMNNLNDRIDRNEERAEARHTQVIDEIRRTRG